MWITQPEESMQSYKSNKIIGFENCKIIQRDQLTANQMKLTILAASKVSKNDDSKLAFELTYKEYAQFCNFDVATAGGKDYKEFFKNAKQLAKLGVDLETEEEWIHFNWLDHVAVNRRAGTLRYQLDPILIELYKANHSEFSIIHLQDYGIIKGKYALILFELFTKWKNQGYVSKTIDQLRVLFQAENKYKQPGDFFYKVVEAVEEINHKTQHTFKIEMDIERGRHRAPQSVKFIINPIAQLSIESDKDFITKKLTSYGIKVSMITMLLTEYSEKYILHNLNFVEEQTEKITSADIFSAINDNISSYTE